MNIKGLMETIGSPAGQKAALEALLTAVKALDERVAGLEAAATEAEDEPVKRGPGRPRKVGQ